MDVERARELDARLVLASKQVRVLSSLTWGDEPIRAFLEGWRRGQPRVPVVESRPPDSSETRAELEAVAREADPDDPLQAFVGRTASSYALAARMLESIGTPAFAELSAELYGAPHQRIPGGGPTHEEIAETLLANTDDLRAAGIVREEDLCLTADTVRQRLEADFAPFFGDRAPRIEIDPDLASKATAGSRRVRLRGRTCFSELDVAQLREHEGFVHAATMLNGRAQPVLGCLGLGSPRSTLTQEGLATFAEVVTRRLDIARLRRLALRTKAIQAAFDGADFVELFRLFLDAGQSADESARSAMRVVRGGDPRGRVPFTKDVVYLHGLFAVHTFLRKAIAESRPELVRRLFAGRLALRDVLELGPAFEAGHIEERALLVAPWATQIDRLGAYLAFGAVLNRIDLRRVELEHADAPGPGLTSGSPQK